MANTRRVPVTVDHLLITSDQTGMVKLSARSNLPDEMFDPIGANKAKSDGTDIRVYSDAGVTEMRRQIVAFTYDSVLGAGDGTCEIWLTLPTWVISSLTDTTYYLEYGDGTLSDYAVGDTFGRNAVWSDYAAVLHLNEASGNGTAGEFVDSTGNGNDAHLTTGSSITGVSTSHPWGGSWLDFTTAEALTLATSKGMVDASDITLSVWVNLDTSSTIEGLFGNWNTSPTGLQFIQMQTGGRGLLTETGTQDFFSPSSASTATNHLFHLVWDRSVSLQGYLDGATNGSDSSLANTTGITGDADFRIGTYHNNNNGSDRTDGRVGECRARASVSSANRINAEHANQNSPSTFSSPGTPVAIGGGGGFQPHWAINSNRIAA